MKTLILVRHAESGWQLSGNDKDRLLTEKGTRDAQLMAKLLSTKQLFPEIFIVSPAKRARQTMEYFMHEQAEGVQEMIEEKLYSGDLSDYFHITETIPESKATALIVAHNPVISNFAHEMMGNSYIQMVPGTVCALQIRTEHWSDISWAEKELMLMESPNFVVR